MMLRSSRLFKQSVVVIYWIALPLCLLTVIASFTTIGPAGDYRPSWGLAVGGAALASAIGWRLWLNARALRRDGPPPSLHRLLLIFLPLTLLALAGLVAVLLGAGWIGLGVWSRSSRALSTVRCFIPRARRMAGRPAF